MASWRNTLLRLWPFRSDNIDSSTTNWGRKTETRKIARALGPWEAYMVTLQSILIWESPGTSALAVVGVNVLFWFVVWSEVRVYFVAPMVALAVFLHQQWVHTIWPEIRVPKPEPDDTEEWTPVHPSVLSVPEISGYVEGAWRVLRDNYTWLLHLRRVQPALFCAIVCTVLSVGAVVGHLVPGAVLVYIVLMAIMTGPGIMLHVLPDSFYQRVARMRAALRGDDSEMEISNLSLESDLTEFMPELQSEEAQAALDVPLMSQDPPEVEAMVEEAYLQEAQPAESAARRRVKKNGKNDPATPTTPGMLPPLEGEDGLHSAFFTSGLPEDFPSYDHDSVEDLDGPDIELPDLPRVVREPSAEPLAPSGDRGQMEFVSSHFGDSSEEEDAFLEGLTFEERSQVQTAVRAAPPPAQSTVPTTTTMDPIGQLMTSMIAQNAGNVLSALGQNLIGSVIGQATVQGPPPSHLPPRQSETDSAGTMTRSQEQQRSVTDFEEDFELISDEEFQ